MTNYCTNCDCKYYVGRKYHQQLMKVFWRINQYLLAKLSIPDIHELEDNIVELEKIYEEDFDD